jgi:hypothetical protein
VEHIAFPKQHREIAETFSESSACLKGVSSQGISRFTWNWALAEWNRQYEAGEKPTALKLKKQFNAIRREHYPWTWEVTKNASDQGTDLPRTANTPMARLQRQGNQVIRKDIWPTEADYGLPVLLAGGEVGILQQWWNDPEEQQWRWRVEFYNHR